MEVGRRGFCVELQKVAAPTLISFIETTAHNAGACQHELHDANKVQSVPVGGCGRGPRRTGRGRYDVLCAHLTDAGRYVSGGSGMRLPGARPAIEARQQRLRPRWGVERVGDEPKRWRVDGKQAA